MVAGFSKAWNPKAVNPFSSNAKVEFNDKIEKLSEPNQLYLVFLEGLSSEGPTKFERLGQIVLNEIRLFLLLLFVLKYEILTTISL